MKRPPSRTTRWDRSHDDTDLLQCEHRLTLIVSDEADSPDMSPSMTPKRRAEKVARRLRAAAQVPLDHVVAAAADPVLAGVRARTEALSSIDLPHVAGRLDARYRISLHALDVPAGFGPGGPLDVAFVGPWAVLTTADGTRRRDRCGLESRMRNANAHLRLRLSSAAVSHLRIDVGDLVLAFADVEGERLLVTAPGVLAAAALVQP